jgi:Outer membrane protein beta-barrel domain
MSKELAGSRKKLGPRVAVCCDTCVQPFSMPGRPLTGIFGAFGMKRMCLMVLNLIALVVFFGSSAFAQDAPAPPPAPAPQAAPPAQPAPAVEALPSAEIAGDYSFLHVPSDSFIPSFNLNGGGASLAYFFNKHFGLKVDFQDYGKHSLNFAVAGRTQGCNSQSGCPISAEGTMFTYTGGPVVRFRVKHFEPFAEVLFGGAHDNVYASIYNQCFANRECINLSKMPNNNAFDFIIGGGVDIPFKEHIAIRLAQVDYDPTRFGNSLKVKTGNSNVQSNIRAQAGIVFKF